MLCLKQKEVILSTSWENNRGSQNCPNDIFSYIFNYSAGFGWNHMILIFLERYYVPL